MKKATLVVLCCAAFMLIAGCGKGGVDGRYYNKSNSASYIHLEKDGSFVAQVPGKELRGEYALTGNVIVLSMKNGHEDRGTIQGDTLVDGDGEVWVRQ